MEGFCVQQDFPFHAYLKKNIKKNLLVFPNHLTLLKKNQKKNKPPKTQQQRGRKVKDSGHARPSLICQPIAEVMGL